jgi:branched-chain amino acid transport system substrate-binding protein
MHMRMSIFLAALFIACGSQSEEVNIGVIITETGYASYLMPVKYGLDLACDEVNAHSRQTGKIYRTIYRDSGSIAEGGVEAALDLLENEDIDVIISVTSAVSNAIAEIAEQYQVPVISLVASDPKVTTHNSYMYRYYFTATDEILPMLPVISNSGVKSVGILFQDEDYGKSIRDEFIQEIGNLDLSVIPSPFQLQEKDFQSVVTKVIGTDAVVIAGFEQNCILTLETLAQSNYSGMIFGTSTLSSRVFRDLPESEGIYVSAPAVYNPNYRLVNDIRMKFQAVYGIELNHNAATGYDLIILLDGLVKKETKVDAELIYQKLRQEFVFPGLFGDIRKEALAREIRIPLYPARIEGGELKF